MKFKIEYAVIGILIAAILYVSYLLFSSTIYNPVYGENLLWGGAFVGIFIILIVAARKK